MSRLPPLRPRTAFEALTENRQGCCPVPRPQGTTPMPCYAPRPPDYFPPHEAWFPVHRGRAGQVHLTWLQNGARLVSSLNTTKDS